MRLSILFLAATALACAPADQSSVTQAGGPEATLAVKATIDSAHARFAAAVLRGDSVSLANEYADNGMVLAPGMKVARGRAEILHAHASMFAAATFTEFTGPAADVLLDGNHAIVTGTYQMTFLPKTKGAKAVTDVGKYVEVWEKQADGSWKMIRDIFNSDGAP
jgi:uncharacterized protein (TIGR02246 family)